MKRVRIDFAAPGLARTVHRAGVGTWALLLLGVGLSVAAALMGNRLMAQQEADAAQLAKALQRDSAPVVVAVAAEAPRISEAQAAAVNTAVLQLNLPWRALQEAIASATPPSIAMLALEPDARKGSITITAEAKTSDDMIAYVEKLKGEELFAGVTLTRHEINSQDPNRPIRFQLDAEWARP